MLRFQNGVFQELLLLSATGMEFKSSGSVPATPKFFPEAPRRGRTAGPLRSLLCFSLDLDFKGLCSAQLHRGAREQGFKKGLS